MSDDERRIALVIGVGTFDPRPLVGEIELLPSYGDLDFAVPLAEAMRDALTGYRRGGFRVELLRDPDRTSIRDAIDAVLDDKTATARLIHVISHGHLNDEPDRVEVVGRCQQFGFNNVRDWLSRAQTTGVPTLFLVDLCGAGRAANLAFTVEPDEQSLKALVLAAARGHENAKDGAFTRALVDVMVECGRDGLGTGTPYVPVGQFARRVMDRLALQSMVAPPITGTKLSFFFEPDLPILPNPLWQADSVVERVATLDVALQPFLTDAVADAKHFQVKAGAYFSGRRKFLDRLVPWLDGEGDGGLWMVTGAAGVGKSALLGAMVCAAHPVLADITGAVRMALDHPPALNPLLIAVHARQRTVDEIVESIAAQLSLPAPETRWSAADLVASIRALPRPPVLVVDALDECQQAGALQALLLLPLHHSRRYDGTPAARILVAARPWDQFTALRAIAEADDRLTDLDATAPDDLKVDLRRYLIALLNGMPFAEPLATGIAARLAADHAIRMDEPAADRWGQFLVAGRYARFIHERPPKTRDEADSVVDRVPLDLPKVLELELSSLPNGESVRIVLAALAHAKGAGMPLEVVRSVSAVIGDVDPYTLLGDDASWYLRTESDDSGVSLFRLYHQGLADYLREYPINPLRANDLARPVYEALMDSRRNPGGGVSWEHAPLYLQRHMVNHAVDARMLDELLEDGEFLVHAVPETLLPELDKAGVTLGQLGAAIYRSVYHLLDKQPVRTRRQLLRLTALRFGGSHPAATLPWDDER